MVEQYIEKAKVLLEALPYLMRFRGKIFVIKLGGAAMVQEDLKARFAEDILLLHMLGIHAVVVHGGGPQIGKQLKKLGVDSQFINGMRVTTAETMRVVEEVLVGGINKEIVSLILSHGGNAVGISGKDGRLIEARKIKILPDGTPAPSDDLGYVGEVEKVNTEIVHTLVRNGFIPIIAPVGADRFGATYNLNADVAASQLAVALQAEKLILMTDVEGVKDKKGTFYAKLTAKEAERRTKDGTIAGGMIPKVHCCVNALRAGVIKAHIIDGRIPHAILLEIFTDQGIGTEIHLAGRSAHTPGHSYTPGSNGSTEAPAGTAPAAASEPASAPPAGASAPATESPVPDTPPGETPNGGNQ